jgi:hypothetical protein
MLYSCEHSTGVQFPCVDGAWAPQHIHSLLTKSERNECRI